MVFGRVDGSQILLPADALLLLFMLNSLFSIYEHYFLPSYFLNPQKMQLKNSQQPKQLLT